MTSPRTVLAQALHSEIENLHKVRREILDYRNKFGDSDPADMLLTRGIASALTDVYQGAENAFQRIGRTTEEGLPSGSEWHRLLLDQMTREVSGVRPSVISDKTKEALEE